MESPSVTSWHYYVAVYLFTWLTEALLVMNPCLWWLCWSFMANSPDADGRHFLPAIAPISGGVVKSTVMDRRHGWDIHPSMPQRPQSELEWPHMHVHFINQGTARVPGWGLFFHSEQTGKKSGCNNAALANFSLVGVRQFKKPSRYEAPRKLIFKFLCLWDTDGPPKRE